MALREFEFVSNDLDGYKHVFSKAASDFTKGHGDLGHIEGLLKAEEFYEMGES